MASHRRSSPSCLTRTTILSAAVATVAAALAGAPAGAGPGDSAREITSRIDRLFEQAEQETEEYNAATERADRLREQVEHAQDRVARGQERVNRMRGALATIIGAQYRSGGVGPVLALLLSEDPDGYLDTSATLERITSRAASRVHKLRQAQRSLRQQRDETGGKLAELERARISAARHKKAVRHKLATARRLLDALPPEERAAYGRATRAGDRRGVDQTLSGAAAPSSARAAAAVAAARRAIGSPYVWGHAGPYTFDCSGLTQWAYRQAGVSIPRTSQAQAHAGRQLPLDQARPGDLVLYRSDASHVAMYMGNGQVVHAPRPGARVRYDPVGMMPVSAVTRP